VQTTTAAPPADLIPDSRAGWKQKGTMLAITIIPFVAFVAAALAHQPANVPVRG